MADKTAKKEGIAAEKQQTTSTVKTEKNTAEASKPAENNPPNVSMYTIDELVAAEKELDASKVIIRIALQKAEKDLFSIEEAKEIVKNFKKKEVK